MNLITDNTSSFLESRSTPILSPAQTTFPVVEMETEAAPPMVPLQLPSLREFSFAPLDVNGRSLLNRVTPPRPRSAVYTEN